MATKAFKKLPARAKRAAFANMAKKTRVNRKEKALRSANFFVGGLSDAGIKTHYSRMKKLGKI